MRILFIVARLPYPPLKGDQVRAFHQLRLLSRIHAITLVCFVRPQDHPYLDEVAQYCEHIEAVPWTWPGSISHLVRFPVSRFPLQTLYYQSSQMVDRIRHLVTHQQFDVVHTQMIRMAPYSVELPHAAKVLDLIDALSINMQRRYQRDTSLLKPLWYWEYHRVRQYERKLCTRFARVLVVSRADRNALGNPSSAVINPNGVDTKTFPFVLNNREPATLIFSGNMGYFPNRDAIHWFHDEIWPHVQEAVPEVRLYIVGADPTRDVRRLGNRQNVTVTGLVPDIHPYLARVTVSICPMRSGSGMQNKVLEAMSAGTPVVATSQALSGIEVYDNAVIVTQDAREFASAVIRLLCNPQERRRLALAARALVQENYTWEGSVQHLCSIYEGLVAEKQVR